MPTQMGQLHRYPAYTDSGVAWLGKVPAHWRVLPNRAVFEEVVERDHPDDEMLSVTITQGVIRQQALLRDSSKKDSSNHERSAYKLVRTGDIVYNKMRAWQGAIGVSSNRGIVSPAYVVQRSRQIGDPRYLHYLLRTAAFAKEAERWSYGITSDMWSLRPEHFRLIYACLPPLPEQAAIVRFLDFMDRRIQRLIRAKQKLIKLLEEEKRAIIRRAVTRGLDPDVPLKPSGVGWLGEIPEHWQVSQIGHLGQVGNGSTPSRGNAAYWKEGQFPWLNSAHANQERITRADQFVTKRALRDCHLPIVPKFSVLVAITGQGKTRGKAALLCFEATINQHLAFITPRPTVISAEFLRLALNGAYIHLREISDHSGSTKGALTCADLRHFRIAFPSMAQQNAILMAVERKLITLDAAANRLTDCIRLFQEYRTRLIADVVTGKLDVREAAARLPEEIEEAESVEEIDEEAGDGEDMGNGEESAEVEPE